MNLSLIERVIIANQLKIFEKLYPDEAEHYSLQRKAIEYGYSLHYDDVFEHFSEEMSMEECREVIDILDMYRAITFSYRDLQDKEGIKESEIHFDGFDGNLETSQLLYTQYFVVDLGRFQELTYGQSNPDFNSHMPMQTRYRRMLEVWKSYADKFSLSADQIRKIIEE